MTENHGERAQRALQNSDVPEALVHARASLAAGEAGAHRLMAIVLPFANRSDEALTHARLAVIEDAAIAMDFARLAALLQAAGKNEEAVSNFRRATELEPHSAILWNELGVALSDVNLEDAENALQKAIYLAPEMAEIHNNLGNILKARGAPEKALKCYETALERKPDYWEARGNLGVVHQVLGQADASIRCFEAILKVRPKEAQTWTHYGAALAMKGELEASETAHRRSISLEPALPDAYNNLAIVLKDQGRLDEACEAYRHVITLDPDDSDAHSNYLMCLCYDYSVGASEMVAAHQEWARQFTPTQQNSFDGAEAHPGKILTIGYVSPDFRSHPVASFLDCLFEAHNRDNFRIICYSDVAAPDDFTARIRGRADLWRIGKGLDDDQLRAQIIGDGVDILIDLAGHTANNRLRVFAGREAPVQISWLGYGATTGLDAMDYVLSDERTD
ncbi:MAG: tetratricopeptide repeat protein, partial [Alphaproteobacteria bacterium]|nr:tetratricopeptide repeat protein [Alphaproteobacteria bacterium]